MRPVSLLLVSVALLGLVGCASSDGGDGGSETPNMDARKKIDSSMTKEQQDELSTKVKAWDPKKDKKK